MGTKTETETAPTEVEQIYTGIWNEVADEIDLLKSNMNDHDVGSETGRIWARIGEIQHVLNELKEINKGI